MSRALLNMRAFTNLVNHFTSRCSIFEDSDSGFDEHGQPSDTYTLKAGHQDIPCVKGVLPGQANMSERRRQDYTASIDEQTVLLKGYWPDITDSMRAVIDGVGFNITGVDQESQTATTRLRVERLR